MNIDRRNNLAGLFKETGHAHHEAFADTDGADPDWPIWYADYLKEPFAERFDMIFYKSQLIYCLMDAGITRYRALSRNDIRLRLKIIQAYSKSSMQQNDDAKTL